MSIVVLGQDARADAVRELLVSGGYAVISSFGGSTPDAVILANGKYDLGLVDDASGARSTVLIDATNGHFDRTALEAAGKRLGTERLVRALLVLPQAGANVLLCADDRDAMHLTQTIFQKCGCIPTDRGPLSNAAELQPPDRSLDAEFKTLKSVNTTTN
jgi:predicted dinucleotide-binding enzyme